jgi:ATP/maltotriose-dependent transcriptional regulator MalT/DNA-binding SARP family transcriptional activator
MLTIPATRLLVPARPAPDRLLERKRLLEELTQRRRKLMLLLAPAGFGKTTLALDYIATNSLWQVGEAIAWLSLDLGGIVKWDARIFIQALGLALKNALPSLDLSEIESELAELPIGTELSEETAAYLIFALSNALKDQPRPVLLTIDDFHLVCDQRSVRDARLINDLVNTLLVTSPGQLRILICSRAYPRLDTLKLHADDELVVIDKSKLKFTEDEITAFLRLRNKNVSLAEQVMLESEGWAAAVALKLQHFDMEAHLKDQNYGGAFMASSHYNVLAEEMLKQLDRPLRRLLESCSVLDHAINAGVASRLISCYEVIEAPINEANVESQLQKLESSGQLERHRPNIIPQPAEQILLYRMHNLLKEYLERNLDPQTSQALNSAACSYYREKEDWEQAFEHALKAGNHLLAAEILEERAYEEFKNRQVSKIEQHIKRLDESTLDKHPHLLMVAGMINFVSGNTDKALAFLHAANRRFGRFATLDNLVNTDKWDAETTYVAPVEPLGSDNTWLLKKAETIVSMAKLWQATGRNQKAIGVLEGIKNFLDQPFDKSPQIEERRLFVLALARRFLGDCFRMEGRYNDSIEELTRAINIFLQLNDGYNVAASRQNLGIAWRQLGNQARAELNFQQALEYWERQGNATQHSITLNSLAVGLINEGGPNYQEAIKLLLKAYDKAQEAKNEAFYHYILAGLGDAYLGMRDIDKALKYYSDAGAEASRQNHFEMLTYAKLGTARARRRGGDLVQTRQAVLAALDYAAESTDGDRAAATLENGVYLLLNSHYELAQANLEGALNLAHKVEARQTEALAHFWLAYLSFRTGRYKLAGDNMRKAINLAQTLGYDAFLREELAELPAEFAEHFQGNSNDLIGAFFARGEDYGATAAPKIELRAFGKSRIMRGGQEVPSVSRKARELIFLLVEEKIPVSGERISEALWPEMILAGNGLGSGFYSTITHARRALGNPESIRAADGAYSINLRYFYDIDHFEEHLARAERSTEPEMQIEYLALALELVNGDFLAEVDSPWAQQRRQELFQKKLRILRMLANAFRSIDEREKALEILSRLMQADPYDEQAVRDYVELLAESKSKTIAVNFLRRKMDELIEEGIEPEEETQAIYNQLDASRSIAKRRRS